MATNTLCGPQFVCKVSLAATYLVIAFVATLLWVSFILNLSINTMASIVLYGCVVFYVSFTYSLLYQGYYKGVLYLLVLFYALLASGVMWIWKIDTSPVVPILLGMIVVCVALAITFWLCNRKIKQSLAQAQRSEEQLTQQKVVLERRADHLRQMQMEEMQQMYRFAELGQAGVTLLHDLANNLSVLTLEIDNLKNAQQTQEITRAKYIIKYLEDIIDNTRDWLHGGTKVQTFDIIRKVTETIAFLSHKATKAHVSIEWQPPVQSLEHTGDTARFNQVVAYIINNAIEAYESTPGPHRVRVMLEFRKAEIVIKIIDWGKGISRKERKNLFKPFQSTKKSGLGLGLFLAKQMIEVNFSGTISLASTFDRTEFIIVLPRVNKERKKSNNGKNNR